MSYMLWMLKRVFFGKLPENLQHVKKEVVHDNPNDGSRRIFNCSWNLSRYFLETIIPYMNGVDGGLDYDN